MGGKKKGAGKFSIKKFIDGQVLTEEFVSKQLKLLVLIVGLIIVFISNNYACMKKLATIEALEVQLKDVEYEHLVLSAKLISISTQSQVKELLEQKGINLSSPTNPAFEISK